MAKITGILDINNPRYPFIVTNDGEDSSESHLEPPDNSAKSNVVEYEHPIFSGNGIISTINFSRNHGNTEEEELDGKVENKVFEDVSNASKKFKVPADLLLFLADWDEDLTSRSGASDAEGIAQKVVQYVPELRSLFGRDPLMAEVFAAYAFESASEAHKRWELSNDKPEEDALNAGTSKDNIIFKKTRHKSTKKRTNREAYDFFYRRLPFGKLLFKSALGEDKYAD